MLVHLKSCDISYTRLVRSILPIALSLGATNHQYDDEYHCSDRVNLTGAPYGYGG